MTDYDTLSEAELHAAYRQINTALDANTKLINILGIDEDSQPQTEVEQKILVLRQLLYKQRTHIETTMDDR